MIAQASGDFVYDNPSDLVALDPRVRELWWLAGSPQHAAASRAEFQHRPPGHLPEPELTEANHVTTIWG
jgi:hypothetical protein